MGSNSTQDTEDIGANGQESDIVAFLSYGNYRTMMEDTHTVQVSGHCKIAEGKFPMKKWINISPVSKDCIDRK